ncbi:complement C1q-like protein 4 [Sardina pilchardus]|uniref:complement C1q-like protein 4 n=1 Tax=Sardina pilchardus TaxID=27697 RepID=UPI002E1306A2
MCVCVLPSAQAANLNLTAGQVEELRREREERRVSFSASVVTSGAGNTGPYSAATTLIYRNVISNIGNGYNKNTGVFTAPVRGVYHFAVSLSGSGSRAAAVHLYKNGAHVVIAYTATQNSFTSSSNGASLLLEVGDVVYVNLRAHAWVYDDMERYTTFSGHLLFTM